MYLQVYMYVQKKKKQQFTCIYILTYLQHTAHSTQNSSYVPTPLLYLNIPYSHNEQNFKGVALP